MPPSPETRGHVQGDVQAVMDRASDPASRRTTEQPDELLLMQFALDQSSDAVIWTDSRGRLVYANETTCRCLGYSREELLRLGVPDIDLPVAREERPGTWSFPTSESSWTRESVFRRQDGSIFPVEIRGYSLMCGAETYCCCVARDITKSKDIEEALLVSERALETSPDHVSIVGPDYTYRRVNEAYVKVHGTPKQDIVGHHVSDVLGTEIFQRVVRPNIDRCLAGEEVTYEAWFTFRTAGRKFMHVTYFPLRTTSGQVEGVVVISRDITPLREAQEALKTENATLEERVAARTQELQTVNAALRASQERFRALYEDNPSMYFMVDGAGTVLSVNRFGAEQLGYRPDELVGGSVLDVFHEEDRASVSQALADAFACHDRIHQWQFRKRHRHGLVLWVHESVRTMRDPGGMPVALIVCEDITDRKLTEDALRASEERLDLAMRAARVGFLDWDTGADTITWSPTVARILGVAEDSLAGTREAYLEFVHPDDRRLIAQTFSNAIDSQQPYHVEHRIVRPDGSIHWVECNGKILPDQAGHSIRMIGTVRDITERKRTETALLAGERAIRTLYHITSDPEMSFEDRMRALLDFGRERFKLPIGILTKVEGDDLVVAQVRSSLPGLAEGMRLPISSSYCHGVLATDDPILIEHVESSSWNIRPGHKTLGHKCYMGAKVTAGNRVYGTLCFLGQDPHQGPFSQADRDLFQLMAIWIGPELDRRRTEAMLRRTQFAVDHAADMVVWIDDQAKFQYVNEAACHRLGYRRDELLSMTLFDVSPERPREEWPSYWETLRTFKRLRFETTHQASSGEIYPIEVVSNHGMFEGKEYEIAFARDISERKRGELKLRESEERFRSMFEDAPVGLCIVGGDKTIRKINPAFRKLVGYEEHEILGKTYALYTHPDDLAHNLTLTDRFLRGEVNDYSCEKRYIRKNGEVIWVNVAVSPLTFPGFPERTGLGVVQDITARKLAEQALTQREQDLRHALEEREQVSQDLHDGILQSLYAVGLSLDATGRLVSTSTRRAKQELTGAISQLNRTIQEIRSFITGLSSDLLDVTRFTQVLESVTASFCKGGRTRCDIAVSPEAVRRLTRHHCVHLLNIVREAVSNSVRHGRANHIRVDLRVLRERLRLAVQDDGHGFDPTTARTRGYGLRNMRSRATKLGAGLHIHSKPDSGTRIVVNFGAEAHD